MATYVRQITLEDNLQQEAIYFHLDAPTSGSHHTHNILQIAGWLFSPSRTITSLSVILERTGRFPSSRLTKTTDMLLETTRPLIPRPKVESFLARLKAPRECGFDLRLNLSFLDEATTLRLSADLQNGPRTDLARIRFSTEPFPKTVDISHSPLLVSAFGRSGTTLLMRLLSSHDGIITTAVYPYEHQLLRSNMNSIMAMVQPFNPPTVRTNAGFRNDARNFAPWHFTRPVTEENCRWLGDQFARLAARFGLESIDSYYRHVGLSTRKSKAKFFAEKDIGDSILTHILERVLGRRARKILLIRDFRDIFCSVQAFNQKRGNIEFVRREFPTDVEYLRFLGDFTRDLILRYRSEQRQSVLVRYQDLVRETRLTMSRICYFLELNDLSANSIAGILAQKKRGVMADHKTTLTSNASVGRWRQELSEDLREIAATEYRDVLEYFQE